MFTVKHRAADGVITLHTCETVEVVRMENVGEAYFNDGIFLDRDPIPLDPSNPNSPRSAKHIIAFGGEQTEAAKRRKGGRVWIMNEAGNTVDAYDL